MHCPNTGSMRECLAPGASMWYSTSDNTKRKYPHTWEIATTPAGDLAGINTHRANTLVKDAIERGLVPELQNVAQLAAEVKFGAEGSRADFLVNAAGVEWVVEVKNVTLKESGMGYFPDAVTERGTKHLRELTRVVESGGRALLVFCIQHTGIDSVSPAGHIDAKYHQAFTQAMAQGVKFCALKATISPDEIVLTQTVPVVVSGV